MALPQITAEEFDDRVRDAAGTTVVLFYMDRCPYCRAFKPHFEAAVKRPPLRWLAVRITQAELARQDRNAGRATLWLRLLDRFGVGFTS